MNLAGSFRYHEAVPAIVLILAIHSIVHAAGPDEIMLHGTWSETACGFGADVWGEGHYAFWGHFSDPCVDILDISDPADPQWVAAFQASPPDEGGRARDVKVHDGLAYVALEGEPFNAAAIVDVRDPANPVLLTTVRPQIGGFFYDRAHNLFFHQGYLYLTDLTLTVFIVDLTQYDPDNPPATITGAKWLLTNVGTDHVHDITVLRDRMYVAAWDQIMIYDITNIDTEIPSLLGQGPGNSTHSVWATDDERFVVTAEERDGGGIKLYEVIEDGDGLAVVWRDEVVEPPPTFSAHNPVIVGNRVYTSWYASGLIVHEIDRENGRLVEIGRINPGITWGVYPFLGLDRVIIGGAEYIGVVDASLCAPVTDDFDGDDDVDFEDFAGFQRCAGLPFFNAPCAQVFDADCDGDVDVDDYVVYLSAVTGPSP